MNRQARTKLPIVKKMLEPKLNTHIEEQFKKKTQNMEKYYNSGTKLIKI